MFKAISEKLRSFFQRTGLDQHIVRMWAYRNISYVVDFSYQDVKFGFDISPLVNGRFLLEMVERRHKVGSVLVDTANRKQLLSRNATMEEVMDLIRDHANQSMIKIGAYLSGQPLPPAVTTPAPIALSRSRTMKSLRVGVMTLPLNANIGGNLQAYAMLEVLRRLGHSPVFINSKRPPTETSKKTSVGPADLSQPLLTNSVGLAAHLPNVRFVDRYLVPITVPFNSKELLARDIDRLGLDAIIAGSDQIWRPKYSRSRLTNYFFDFLPVGSKVKRISYAASFGAPDWEFNAEQTREAARLIKYFDAVGVREDKAVELCAEHLGVQAQHVLDPTLLLDPEAYKPVIAEAEQGASVGQVVTYLLDITQDKAAVVEELARTLSLKAFATTGQSFSENIDLKKGEGDRSVQHWLASLSQAAFIVTDSFHGVAFSILFNKPFIAYGNPSRGISRFTSLLKMVGLEDRLVTKSSEVNVQRLLEPIDWASVNEKLNKYRAESFGFLMQALSGKSKVKIVPSKNNVQASVPMAANDATGGVFEIQPKFVAKDSEWSVSKVGQAVQLSVADGAAAKLRNLAWCELPVPLQIGARYRLLIKWAVRTTGRSVKPCIRNPVTGKIYVLSTLVVDERMREMHTDIIDFAPPGDGFSQFVLGAASFSGDDGGAKIEAMTLQAIGAPPKARASDSTSAPLVAGYAEKARKLALKDSDRYARAYVQGDPLGGARARIMYAAHAIEKGLSHSNFRPGFGKTAIERLTTGMSQWLEIGGSINDPFFKSGLSAMHCYFKRHATINFDVSTVHKQFSPELQKLIAEADDTFGGVAAASNDREIIVESGHERTFLDIVYSRRSVREFTSAPVRLEDIRQAVHIASQAPSVCNRQGPRAHYFSDQQQIRALVDLQKGFGGYEKPPGLLLVTCDLTAFIHAKERNQAFVDGGLFLMGLLLGLEQVGLGACPLNTTMDADRENDIRKVLKISEYEVLISFVAVGHYEPSVLVPRSIRYPVDNLLYVHNQPPSVAALS